MSLQLLREQTAPMHRALEQDYDLFADINSIESYGQHLSRVFCWLQPLEDGIAHFASSLPADWPARRRSNLVARDLTYLNVSHSPAASSARAFTSVARCFGVMYVLEGSTLGAQVIGKRLTARLGVEQATGMAFYSGYGKDTAAMWKKFLSQLNQTFAAHPDWTAEIADAACETFRSYAATVPVARSSV
jgi:heme oxygenase (biliverdin-IX-beta and delta-forming)